MGPPTERVAARRHEAAVEFPASDGAPGKGGTITMSALRLSGRTEVAGSIALGAMTFIATSTATMNALVFTSPAWQRARAGRT
jgi:hypothetical protein